MGIVKLFSRYISKPLSCLSITKKILLIFVACVVVPILILNVYYFGETERSIQQQLSDKMNATLGDKILKLEYAFNDIINMSIRFNNNNQLYRVLDKDYDSDLEYLVAYQDYLTQTINADLPLHLSIDKVYIYCDNPTLLNSGLVRHNYNFDTGEFDIRQLTTTRTPIKAEGNTLEFRVMLTPQKNQESVRSVSVMRNLQYYPEYRKYQKAVMFEINSSYFDNLLSDMGLFENLLIVDRNNCVLFSANSYKQSGVFDLFDEEALPAGYEVLEQDVSGYPLTLYGYYSTEMFTQEFQKGKYGSALIAAISLLMSGVLIMIIGNNITKRTNFIVNHAASIAKGNFILAPQNDFGKDELAEIERSIHNMSLQLQEYIEREYTAKLTQSKLEQENTQAKLLALQGQVNPHFLFNALESIRLNALDHPPQETAQMIKNMSKLFRHLVDWDEDIVRVKDDMAFLYEFLSIQKYRFGDEFHYEVDLDTNAENCLLPKLILQPLVENACVHGVEAISNDKWVRLSIKLEQDELVLIVQDNGGGVPAERLVAIQNMLDGGQKVNGSVGVYNVYQRLLLNYGEKFIFKIDSEEAKGTRCMVRLPAQQQEGD